MSARDIILTALRRAQYAGVAGTSREPADLVDAHRAEVVAEAGLLPKADVVAWLIKKAREEKSWDAAVLASKVARGAVRPDNLRTLPADFFEPDHTYTRGYWTFQCLAIEPISWGNREPRAVGYLTRNDGTGTVTGLDPDDWAHGGWVDVTDTTRKDGA